MAEVGRTVLSNRGAATHRFERATGWLSRLSPCCVVRGSSSFVRSRESRLCTHFSKIRAPPRHAAGLIKLSSVVGRRRDVAEAANVYASDRDELVDRVTLEYNTRLDCRSSDATSDVFITKHSLVRPFTCELFIRWC